MRIIALIISVVLWGLIFGVVSAFAQPVKINVIGVASKLSTPEQSGVISMPLQLQRKIARVGVKRLAAKGINISEGSFTAISDPFPENRFGNDLSIIFREFSAWYSRVGQQGLLRPRTVTHIIAPPFVVGGSRYIGGAAFVCLAPKGGYSYSNAMAVNSRGFNRVVHSLHALMHEVAHSIGAYHSDVEGQLMHPDALLQIEAQISQGGKRQLSILNETRVQIHRCIGK